MSGAAGSPAPTGSGMTKKDANLEMDDMQAEGQLPVESDIMQLARLGEVGAIQKLFDSGRFDAKYKDDEGITPLHWAAINNQYAACKFLLDSGADVDAKGGESVATPAMWAAQRCHYYVVNLMLQYGADPLLTDVQGYNLLHLATFDGNVFLLVLLLHQGIPVDVADPQGHTSLMWAAYKGYPACVDLYLRWGADVHLVDENGFTALHWALVKGSQPCIQKLIEYGSDRFVTTKTGKAPAAVAEEMKTTRIWHRALNESGYDEDGHPKTPRLPFASRITNHKGFASKFFFAWPFLTIWCLLMMMSHLVIFLAVPMTVLLAYTLQWVAQQALQLAPASMNHLHKTPYLAGVFAASCFWVGASWLMIILPNTYAAAPLLNISFATCYGLCTYFYLSGMLRDPGFVPKLGGISEQKAVIDDLLSLWKFDDENFCTLCMVRRPLRSKHCKRCNRCVAKHDHHCPWINNCVGVNNHRPFVLYIIFLEIGILLFDWLALAHLENLPEPSDHKCNILSEDICRIVLKDPFIITLAIWATLQLSWVTMLVIVQMVQVARAQTTYESMRGHQGQGAAEVFTSAMTAGSTSMEGAQLTGSGAGPDPQHPHHHGHRHEGCFSQWKKLLGLDAFVATAQDGLDSSGRRRRRNPFSRGLITNCRDFWCDGLPVFRDKRSGKAMLGGEIVDYMRMYETPPRMKPPGSRAQGAYHSVDIDDNV